MWRCSQLPTSSLSYNVQSWNVQLYGSNRLSQALTFPSRLPIQSMFPNCASIHALMATQYAFVSVEREWSRIYCWNRASRVRGRRNLGAGGSTIPEVLKPLSHTPWGDCFHLKFNLVRHSELPTKEIVVISIALDTNDMSHTCPALLWIQPDM